MDHSRDAMLWAKDVKGFRSTLLVLLLFSDGADGFILACQDFGTMLDR